MKSFFFQFAATVFFLLPQLLVAQWSDDPLLNTAIVDASGEQVVPKVQATSDGGCYISWYDARNGNYDIYMQRLDVPHRSLGQ